MAMWMENGHYMNAIRLLTMNLKRIGPTMVAEAVELGLADVVNDIRNYCRSDGIPLEGPSAGQSLGYSGQQLFMMGECLGRV